MKVELDTSKLLVDIAYARGAIKMADLKEALDNLALLERYLVDLEKEAGRADDELDFDNPYSAIQKRKEDAYNV